MEEIVYGRDRRNFLDDETRYSLVDEPVELEKKREFLCCQMRLSVIPMDLSVVLSDSSDLPRVCKRALLAYQNFDETMTFYDGKQIHSNQLSISW